MELNKPIEMDEEFITLKDSLKAKTEKEQVEHVNVAAVPVAHPIKYRIGRVSVSPPDMIISFEDQGQHPGENRYETIAIPLNDLKRIIRYLYEN